VQGLPNARTTAKNNLVFVHVFDWPAGVFDLYGLTAKVMSARLLANGKQLTFRQTENRLQLDVPAQAPDPSVSVIALKTS